MSVSVGQGGCRFQWPSGQMRNARRSARAFVGLDRNRRPRGPERTEHARDAGSRRGRSAGATQTCANFSTRARSLASLESVELVRHLARALRSKSGSRATPPHRRPGARSPRARLQWTRVARIDGPRAWASMAATAPYVARHIALGVLRRRRGSYDRARRAGSIASRWWGLCACSSVSAVRSYGCFLDFGRVFCRSDALSWRETRCLTVLQARRASVDG